MSITKNIQKQYNYYRKYIIAKENKHYIKAIYYYYKYKKQTKILEKGIYGEEDSWEG